MSTAKKLVLPRAPQRPTLAAFSGVWRTRATRAISRDALRQLAQCADHYLIGGGAELGKSILVLQKVPITFQ
jgi:hypothetical protein